ncbi:16S rRNA (uracil(1498)-N(3))-methyltransferase [Verrucomicrobiales bacterium BCK34]|nr:16S rRNA (uracil(1498)-N(3))-methyltransferase [Verrucomicrobiales bacterium BCK34]
MAKHRFYIPASEWDPENLTLSGDEAHHCFDVMRGREGDRIITFNGEGIEAEAEIISANKRNATLKTVKVTETTRPSAAITLGQAIPKGKNMDLIIQKATELGVSKIVPLLSDRTVVQLNPRDLEKKRLKWQRIAIEACKQCGQNWLPSVETPVDVATFTRERRDGLRLIAAISPEAESLKAITSEIRNGTRPRPDTATLLIGPEGDFTQAEMSRAAEEGFAALSLGPIILRSETAAIYALSIVGYELMG